MTATWTVQDVSGHVVSGLASASRFTLGRKLLPTRYDPFRLEVSSSYRETFDRALAQLLARQGWQLVCMEGDGQPALAS